MSDQELRVEVTRIKELTPMDGMDRIELAWLFRPSPNGEPCIVSKDKFEEGELVAYVPPDHVVPDVEEFAFLERHPDKALKEGATFIRAKHRRVKPMKLHGYVSHGLVVKLGEALRIAGEKLKWIDGEQIGEKLRITRYEPTKQRGQSMVGSTPVPQDAPCGVEVPKYDLTGIRKLGDIFGWESGKSFLDLVATEKLHGTNARYVVMFKGGLFKKIRWAWRVLTRKANPEFEDKHYRLFVSSRGVWRDPEGGSIWARVAKEQRLFTRLKKCSGTVFYGEIIGKAAQGEGFQYGLAGDEVDFRLFDYYIPSARYWSGWDDVEDIAKTLGLRTVPVIFSGRMSREEIEGYEEGTSIIDAGTMREGLVVRTAASTYTGRGGRAIMKWKSEKFLQKHG